MVWKFPHLIERTAAPNGAWAWLLRERLLAFCCRRQDVAVVDESVEASRVRRAGELQQQGEGKAAGVHQSRESLRGHA